MRGAMSLKGFYIRRLFRLQPASLLYLGVIGILEVAHILPRHLDDLASSLFFCRNYVHPHAVEQSWYTAHFWSLAIEEHFYFFLPGFLALTRALRAEILLTLTLLIELTRMLLIDTRLRNYQTDLEAGTITLASAMAVLLTRPAFRRRATRFLRPWVGVTYTVLIWILVAHRPGRPNHALVVSTFPVLVVSTMLHPESLLGRALEWRPLKFLGLISYSVYLWQQLFLTHTFAVPQPHWAALAFVQNGSLRWLAIFTLSIASYYLLERPMMRIGHRLARPATPGREDLKS